MERYGKLVTVKVPLDRYTGRNKGFAFVEFEDRLDAEDALSKLHDFMIDGRRLKLDWDVGQNKKEQIKGVNSKDGEQQPGDEVPVPRSRTRDDDRGKFVFLLSEFL